MRVLAVDQNAVLALDRGLYHAIIEIGGCELVLMPPSVWHENGMTLRAEPEPAGSTMVLQPSSVLFPGKSHRAIYPLLGSLLKSYQPDILFVNAEPESFLAWQAATLCRRMARPPRLVFISWRNIDYPKGGFPYKMPGLSAHAERVSFAVGSHCVVHSEEAKRLFIRKGFDHLTLIPPAVDTKLFSPSTAAVTDQHRIFTIGYVGRIVREKGLHLLLDAIRDMKNARVLLIGDGSYKVELAGQAASLKIADRVQFYDPVPHPQIPNLLRQMDILVLPSLTGTTWKEQFGRVLIEAMACGVPVVGSDSGEIPRVIGNAGLVFKEGSVEELKTRLARLVSSSDLRREHREAGLARVRLLYDIHVVAVQWHRLFSQLSADL